MVFSERKTMGQIKSMSKHHVLTATPYIDVLLMSKLIVHKEIIPNYSIHFADALW